MVINRISVVVFSLYCFLFAMDVKIVKISTFYCWYLFFYHGKSSPFL